MSQQNQDARRARVPVIAGVLLLAGLLALGLGRLRHAPAAAPLAGAQPDLRQLQQLMQAQGAALADPQQLQAMQRQMLQQMQQAVPAQATPPAAEIPPRVQVVKDTPTSVQLAVTLPEGQVAGVTVNFQPGVPYMPNAAEHAAQGREVFGVRLTQADTPDGKRVLLSYVVPTSAIPPELRERILGKAQSAGLELVRAAHAQALNTWTGLQTGYDLGKYGSGIKPKTLGKLYSNYKKVVKAWDSSEQYSVWMQEFDAMERCARNPTQTVTQNAYQQDPGYQQRTIDAIQQARSEAQQAAGLGFVNQEASVAMQLTEAPGALRGVTDKVADWNNAALRDVGNQLVTDTGKLVDCDLAPPPDRNRGDGTIKYHMHRAGYLDYEEEDWVVSGTVNLVPGGPAGGFEIRGEGAFKGGKKSARQRVTWRCEGTSEVSGGGGGGGDGQRQPLWVGGGVTGGDCTMTQPNRTIDWGAGAADAGFRCDFPSVDVVNGGSYEVQADGEEARWTTCELELKPVRK